MTLNSVTKDNFKTEVLESLQIVLVDFWAPWCGPCQALGPVLEDIAQSLGDKVKVVKVNVDDEISLATEYNVSSIPNVVIFEKGKIKGQIIGFHQKQEYLDIINH